MADEIYLIKKESLTSLANEIRTLSDTTDNLSLDAMESNVEDANNEVDIQTDLIAQIADEVDIQTDLIAQIADEVGTQTDLISQIATALEGKAAGGGGGEVTPPTPDDGKTRVYIHLEYGRTSPMLGVCPNGNVTVDWGDGTEPDILTGTSTTRAKWTPIHNYAEPGDHVITLDVNGEVVFYGDEQSRAYAYILRYSNNPDYRNQVYQNAVKKVEIGAGVSIDGYAFSPCRSLTSATIHDGITYIGFGAFYNCYSLTSMTIPESVTSISESAFACCYSLTSVTIPESVTSIDSNAFSNCYGVRYYDFTSCTSVPALGNTSAFTGIPVDCEMLIPAALYDEWSTATNWATYASYMVAV